MSPRSLLTLTLRPEVLEDRCTPSGGMTPSEQYFLELVNRGRANPVGEAARFGIDLNEGLPSGTIPSDPAQPLAPAPDRAVPLTPALMVRGLGPQMRFTA